MEYIIVLPCISFPCFLHMRFVTNISSFPKSFPLRPMYKEVVVSSSLKENTINVWDVNSCTNIFEFKENNGVRNGRITMFMVIP